ncbi:MAG: beta-ketoacyl-ACP synthase 3 [Firmicutes bacterium]|nr:beta-ketoacyl-ACP synthase 3 [Bacillota bacterium]
MGGIRIIGLGKATGERTVTNEEMSRIVDTSDQWIREKTGIRSRYFAENKSNADLAAEAAEMAIDDAGIDRAEIGWLIVCTFTADRLSPSVACSVAGKLGLKEEILATDLNGACTGFLQGCKMAEGLLAGDWTAETASPSGRKSYALVIGSERISPVMDMNDRGTCVLFGDGAGATVLEWNPVGISAYCGGCQPNNEVLGCDRNGHIKMSGQEVYRFAVGTVPHCLNQVVARSGLGEEQIDWFVCHQANERIIDNAARRLKDQEHKFYKNLYWYGNTSAASVPIALTDMKCDGLLKAGQNVVCAGFGAGLTYAGMLLEIGSAVEHGNGGGQK